METFVDFLEPSWNKVLHYHRYSFDPDEEMHDGDELLEI
jgi:hypothetical protein